MRVQHTHRDTERIRAAQWKQTTTTLPDDARRAAAWVDHTGRETRGQHPFCLPAEHAEKNLLPDIREEALVLFAELQIPWHCGIRTGCGNHLLSSQVQCANALTRMVTDPERIRRAFGKHVEIAEVLQIEPGRHLTFEYIGEEDHLGESPDGKRTRGSMSTAADAAFLYRTPGGETELALVEWKYVEEYRRARRPDPTKDATRRNRYLHHLQAADSPVDLDVVPFDDLLPEPFYQLVRQQLLAHLLEKARAHDTTRVRVLHVLPETNTAYQDSLTRESHHRAGRNVDEVWKKLRTRPDRFVHVDPETFADPTVTSEEYIRRYSRRGPLPPG